MSPANRRLLRAAKSRLDDPVLIQESLAQGADVNFRDEYNLTVLIWCARKGHIAKGRALAAAGAELEARDNTRATALHHAVLFRRVNFVSFLIDFGSDVAAVESHGATALDLALWDTPVRKEEKRAS